MRRKDREITDFSAMLAIVADCDCCRLGLAAEGVPYLVPLNFGYEVRDGVLMLYFHGAQEGRKLALLRRNPVAAFEMDTGHRLVTGQRAEDCTFAYRSVMGRGTVTFLEQEAEKRRGLERILAHYTCREYGPVEQSLLNATAVYCLRVKDWTAKEHKVP